MVNVGKLQATMTLDTTQFNREMAKVQRSTKRTAASIQKSFSVLSRSVTSNLTGSIKEVEVGFRRLALLASGIFTGVAVKSFISAGAGLETVRQRLIGVTGSGEGAREAFADLSKLALALSTDLEDLSNSFATLGTIGLESTDNVQLLAATASFVGRSVTDVTQALVSLEAETVRNNFAVQSFTKSGNTFTIVQNDGTKAVVRGRKAAQQYLISLGSLEQRQKSAAAASKDFGTQVGNIKTTFGEAALTLRDILAPTLADISKVLADTTDGFTKMDDAQKKVLADKVLEKWKVLKGVIQDTKNSLTGVEKITKISLNLGVDPEIVKKASTSVDTVTEAVDRLKGTLSVLGTVGLGALSVKLFSTVKALGGLSKLLGTAAAIGAVLSGVLELIGFPQVDTLVKLFTTLGDVFDRILKGSTLLIKLLSVLSAGGVAQLVSFATDALGITDNAVEAVNKRVNEVIASIAKELKKVPQFFGPITKNAKEAANALELVRKKTEEASKATEVAEKKVSKAIAKQRELAKELELTFQLFPKAFTFKNFRNIPDTVFPLKATVTLEIQNNSLALLDSKIKKGIGELASERFVINPTINAAGVEEQFLTVEEKIRKAFVDINNILALGSGSDTFTIKAISTFNDFNGSITGVENKVVQLVGIFNDAGEQLSRFYRTMDNGKIKILDTVDSLAAAKGSLTIFTTAILEAKKGIAEMGEGTVGLTENLSKLIQVLHGISPAAASLVSQANSLAINTNATGEQRDQIIKLAQEMTKGGDEAKKATEELRKLIKTMGDIQGTAKLTTGELGALGQTSAEAGNGFTQLKEQSDNLNSSLEDVRSQAMETKDAVSEIGDAASFSKAQFSSFGKEAAAVGAQFSTFKQLTSGRSGTTSLGPVVGGQGTANDISRALARLTATQRAVETGGRDAFGFVDLQIQVLAKQRSALMNELAVARQDEARAVTESIVNTFISQGLTGNALTQSVNDALNARQRFGLGAGGTAGASSVGFRTTPGARVV